MAFSLHCFTEIPVKDWMVLLNHPDVIRHMPLADTRWGESAVADWAKAKDAQWQESGYGPHAIRIDGHFAGWGGFQREGDEADFALVLLPQYWGQGASIFRSFMRDRSALGIGPVSILLPPSRVRTQGLARLGFSPAGEIIYEGQRFLKFVTQAPAPQA
ncbi:GNAT family N-acetyltransferase [Comamonas composti]|uniref:GNAT family N-acetyltransferase n=1 Tax=Comamonas composti TaxID=408558 RepID=UPI000427BDC1|nr:acetyltransferase [Comamonas composti]